MRKRANFIFKALIFLALGMPRAFAGNGLLDINYLDPKNLAGVIPQNVADQAIKMFGIYTVHRPYSGATSIYHSNGLDLLAEATLVKIGPGLIDALKQDGIGGTPPATPGIPVAKVHIRKSFGESFDIGASGLFYRGQTIIGGDLKIVLHDAEEGPSYALRLGYTYVNVPYAYITSLKTISPEFVVSQKLSFAEPYIGVGGRYITGTISVPFQGVLNIPDFTVEKKGSGSTAYAFTGVFFRILGAQGLRLGVDGTFDISGYHTMGFVFGIGF